MKNYSAVCAVILAALLLSPTHAEAARGRSISNAVKCAEQGIKYSQQAIDAAFKALRELENKRKQMAEIYKAMTKDGKKLTEEAKKELDKLLEEKRIMEEAAQKLLNEVDGTMFHYRK